MEPQGLDGYEKYMTLRRGRSPLRLLPFPRDSCSARVDKIVSVEEDVNAANVEMTGVLNESVGIEEQEYLVRGRSCDQKTFWNVILDIGFREGRVVKEANEGAHSGFQRRPLWVFRKSK